MSPDLSQPLVDAAPMSFFQRLIGIYVHPKKTFEDIVRRPDYVLPLVTVTLVNLLVLWAAIARIGPDRLQELWISWGDPNYSFADHQRFGTYFSIVLLHLQTILAPPMALIYLVAGTILIQGAIFQTKHSFKTLAAIGAYAFTVKILGGFMGLAVLFFGDTSSFSPLLPSPTNLGFFTNTSETFKLFIPMLGCFDILTIWFLVLYWIGISPIAGGKARAGWTVIIWVSSVLSFFFLGLVWIHLTEDLGRLIRPN